nr:proteasome subunit beta type-4-like [Drosophila bipectinata]
MCNNFQVRQPLWHGDACNFNADLLLQPHKLPLEYTTPGRFGTKHNTAAITTGSSVIGVRFDEGVLMAADTLVSYGNMARYQNVDRIFMINKNILLGGCGDFADVQSIKRGIEQKIVEDQCNGDDIEMKPKALGQWMTRVLYERRTRMNPLLVDVVLGGLDQQGKPYLANVDLRGRSHNDFVVATGFARHLTIPFIRGAKPKDREFTLEEAHEMIKRSMQILYYRDTRNNSQYTVGVCTTKKCSVEGPYQVAENWSFAAGIKGY